jgi:hypothetical protein
MSPMYFCHVSFMKISISCLLKSILKVIFLKCNPFQFKETVILVRNKYTDIEKVTQSGTVKREMLTEAIFNLQTNFWFIYFSFLWHKILVLIFNMFIYAKVCHSKFVGMLQIFIDLHPSLIGILFLKLRSFIYTVELFTCRHHHVWMLITK